MCSGTRCRATSHIGMWNRESIAPDFPSPRRARTFHTTLTRPSAMQEQPSEAVLHIYVLGVHHHHDCRLR